MEDEDQKIPEEKYAAELAEDEYVIGDDENYVPPKKVKKEATYFGQIKDAIQKQLKKLPNLTKPSESAQAEQPEDEPALPQMPVQENVVRVQDDDDNGDDNDDDDGEPENANENQEQDVAEPPNFNFLDMPQEPEQVGQDNRLPIDQYQVDLDSLIQNMGQPIDELELGFPQYINFMKYQPIPKQEPINNLMPNDEQLVKTDPTAQRNDMILWVTELAQYEGVADPPPKLPLLPIQDRGHERLDKMPPELNPAYLRSLYNDWPDTRKRQFIESIRQNFPQLQTEFFHNIPHRRYVAQDNDNVDDSDDDSDDEKSDDVVVDRRHHTSAAEEAEDDASVQWLFTDAQAVNDPDKEDPNVVKRLKKEQEELNQLVRLYENKKPKPNIKPENRLSGAINRGLQKHNEANEMRNIKKMIAGHKPDDPMPEPYRGTADIQQLNMDEQMLLLQRFTFQGKLMLSIAFPQWKTMMDSICESQTYLWFSNEEKNMKRFLPIEDCCEMCHTKMDSEPVIRVAESVFLVPIVVQIFPMITNLKCLRLYRFELNLVLIIKKIKENCPRIRHLDLTECYDIQLDVIQELAKSFTVMAHLILSSTNLTEEMLQCLLEKMKSLLTLDVSATLVDGSSLLMLPPGLKRLDLRCCPNLSKELLVEMDGKGSFDDLQHLKMDGQLCQELFSALGCPPLMLIEITQFNDVVVDCKKVFHSNENWLHLLSLKIGCNVVFDESTLEDILKKSPNMRSFSLEFNDYGGRMSDQKLAQIAIHWPHLETLELINISTVGPNLIASLNNLVQLSYLNLTQCTGLRDHFFADFVRKHAGNVCHLILDNCHHLGKHTLDATIVKALRQVHTTIHLSMLRCSLQNLPKCKSKLLPKNLRFTYSSLTSKKYTSFDGNRIQIGDMRTLNAYIKD